MSNAEWTHGATYQRRFFTLLAVFTCLFAVGGAYMIGSIVNDPARASSQAQLATRVAFLDLEFVFDESNQKQAKQLDLEEFIQSTESELKGLEAQHKELKDRLGLLKPDSAQAREIEKEIVSIEAQVKFQSNNAEERLQRQWDAFRAEHIAEIQKLVAGYSLEQGIDVVLQKQLPKQPGAPTWQMVFWSRPDIDITGPILKRLNGN